MSHPAPAPPSPLRPGETQAQAEGRRFREAGLRQRGRLGMRGGSRRGATRPPSNQVSEPCVTAAVDVSAAKRRRVGEAPHSPVQQSALLHLEERLASEQHQTTAAAAELENHLDVGAPQTANGGLHLEEPLDSEERQTAAAAAETECQLDAGEAQTADDGQHLEEPLDSEERQTAAAAAELECHLDVRVAQTADGGLHLEEPLDPHECQTTAPAAGSNEASVRERRRNEYWTSFGNKLPSLLLRGASYTPAPIEKAFGRLLARIVYLFTQQALFEQLDSPAKVRLGLGGRYCNLESVLEIIPARFGSCIEQLREEMPADLVHAIQWNGAQDWLGEALMELLIENSRQGWQPGADFVSTFIAYRGEVDLQQTLQAPGSSIPNVLGQRLASAWSGRPRQEWAADEYTLSADKSRWVAFWNPSGAHWKAIVIHVDDEAGLGLVEVADSLANRVAVAVDSEDFDLKVLVGLVVAANAPRFDKTEWEYARADSPRQTNSSDCGPIAVNNAILLLWGHKSDPAVNGTLIRLQLLFTLVSLAESLWNVSEDDYSPDFHGHLDTASDISALTCPSKPGASTPPRTDGRLNAKTADTRPKQQPRPKAAPKLSKPQAPTPPTTDRRRSARIASARPKQFVAKPIKIGSSSDVDLTVDSSSGDEYQAEQYVDEPIQIGPSSDEDSAADSSSRDGYKGSSRGHREDPGSDQDEDSLHFEEPSDDINQIFDIVIATVRSSQRPANQDKDDRLDKQARRLLASWDTTFGQDKTTPDAVELPIGAPVYSIEKTWGERAAYPPLHLTWVLSGRSSMNPLLPERYMLGSKSYYLTYAEKAIHAALKALDQRGGTCLFVQCGIDGTSTHTNMGSDLCCRYPNVDFRLTIAVRPECQLGAARPFFQERNCTLWGHFELRALDALARQPEASDETSQTDAKHYALQRLLREANEWKASWHTIENATLLDPDADGLMPTTGRPPCIAAKRNEVQLVTAVKTCEQCKTQSPLHRWYRGNEAGSLWCGDCASDTLHASEAEPDNTRRGEAATFKYSRGQVVVPPHSNYRRRENRQELLSHILKIDGEWQCPHIGCSFSSRIGRWVAADHWYAKHAKHLDFACDIEGCEEAFNTEKQLRVHRYGHVEAYGHQTAETNEERKEKHSRAGVLEGKPWGCRYCESYHTTWGHLLLHLLKRHIDKLGPHPSLVADRPWKCEVCPKVYNSQKNLGGHYAKCHPTSARPWDKERGPVQCAYCDTRLSTEKALRAHHRLRHEDQPVQWPTEPIQCEYCPKEFRQREALQSHHLKEHSGEPAPFPGPSLAPLEDEDPQELPFECEHCPKRFTTLAGLRHHARQKHAEQPIPHSGQGLRCQYCSKRYNSLKSLQRHHRHNHGEKSAPSGRRDLPDGPAPEYVPAKGREKPFMCQYCLREYTTIRALQRHHNDSHDGQPRPKESRTAPVINSIWNASDRGPAEQPETRAEIEEPEPKTDARDSAIDAA